jgi:predicted DNA-binding transcriptional regulator YafY
MVTAIVIKSIEWRIVMPKAKRLLELMMTVNRKRKFTAKELAEEFGVSTRTILRDLQELSELGVPLYSEVGPHGGYHVLNERSLPPISFTEEEAIAIFFSVYALRHYLSIPFEAEISSALNKFTSYMTSDIRDRIEQMKNRVDFITPVRRGESPHLSRLLEGAIHQQVLLIEYEAKEGKVSRHIQPIGIYARDGIWYCPAYCFWRGGYRVFRCDRIKSVAQASSDVKPRDIRHVHLGNVQPVTQAEPMVHVRVELNEEGVRKCETEWWLANHLHHQEDGGGWVDGHFPKRDLPFLAKFFMGLGEDATVRQPLELVHGMKEILSRLMDKYAVVPAGEGSKTGEGASDEPSDL